MSARRRKTGTGRLAIDGGPPVRTTLLPYGAPGVDARDRQAVDRVLRSGWVSTGPLVGAFEEALCAATGAQHAVVVSSGTAALHAACHAVGLAGRTLITSPLSFAASANCALYTGGKPGFADVDPRTGNLSAADLAARVTDDVRAVVPVHLAGNPCDGESIARALKGDAVVIEDAAHALGATYGGHRVGSCSHATLAVTSFHPVKVITTGEGGAVFTNDAGLAAAVRRFRDHGLQRQPRPGESWDGPWYYALHELGYNYRLSDIHCALGVSQLARLPEILQRRRSIAGAYRRALSGLDLLELPEESPGSTSSWNLFIVKLELERLTADRRRVFEALRAEGIGVQVHFIPIHLQPLYRTRFGYRPGDFPRAEEFYARCLSLPLFPGMSRADIADVVAAVTKVLEHHRAV